MSNLILKEKVGKKAPGEVGPEVCHDGVLGRLSLFPSGVCEARMEPFLRPSAGLSQGGSLRTPGPALSAESQIPGDQEEPQGWALPLAGEVTS